MDLTTVKVKKGDTLILSLSSNEVDRKTLKALKKELKKVFPKNKIAILGIGQEDRVSLGVLSATKEEK